VLAATSVLDDLIEKCPPAEACRDAFVRMSKATIKMCLSTTGFGNRGNFSNPQQRLNSIDAEATVSMQNLNPNAPYFTSRPNQATNQNNQQKRQPEFDYDLRDLFSAEESASRPFVQYNNMTRLSQAQRHTLNMPHQMPILKAEASNNAISPRQYPPYPGSQTSSALTSPVLTAHAPQSSGYTQQASPRLYGSNISNAVPYSNFANQISGQYPGMSPFSDLDFLDTFPLGQANQGGTNQAQAADPAFTDFNMDFGMGWDGSLPAGGFGDESAGVDLFDGFFFGGQQG
jgi:hypothetical protein